MQFGEVDSRINRILEEMQKRNEVSCKESRNLKDQVVKEMEFNKKAPENQRDLLGEDFDEIDAELANMEALLDSV
jgi:hypothetical protein